MRKHTEDAFVNFEEWTKSVPEAITGDLLWKVKAYRLALFLSDIAWHDATKLMSDRRTMGLSDQLFRAVGSIGANVSEGYSRGSGKDRARFYEYALGSAREARYWYYKGCHIVGPAVTDHRLQLLSEIIRLLLTMIPDQRAQMLHEQPAVYGYETDVSMEATERENLHRLLTNVPLPKPNSAIP